MLPQPLFQNSIQRMLQVPRYSGISSFVEFNFFKKIKILLFIIEKFLQKRFYSGRVDSAQKGVIEQLANTQPNNPGIQAKYLSILNNERDYQSVIQRYESRQFLMNPDATVEYLKALASVSGATNNVNFSNMQPQQQTPIPQQFQQPPQQPNYFSSAQQTYIPPPPQYSSYQTQSRPSSYNSSSSFEPNYNSNASRYAMGSKKNPLYFEQIPGPLDNARKYTAVGASILSACLAAFIIFYLYKTFEGNNAAGVGPSNQGMGIGGSGGSGGDLIKRLVGNFTYEPVRHTNKNFKDIKGIEACMDEIKDVVAFLKDGQKFKDMGAKLPKGILLVGSPGVGKTLLAKAIAGEADVPFFYATGSEFDEVFVGVGAARIKGLFESARKHAPCIIFIDEIDSLGAKRSQRDLGGGTKQTINQLLAEMDGFKSSEGIIVIGATNLPKSLDSALVRPGRFDKTIEVPAPDVQGRKDIINLYLKDKKVDLKPEDVDSLSKRTIGFTGADLENLVNEAAIRAAIKNDKAVNWHHIEYAYDRITLGLEHRFKLSDEEKLRTAVHEAGHAIITLIRGFDAELHKVTINPRGRALGVTFSVPKDSKHFTKMDCLKQIEQCLGGIVAEEVFYGKENVTLGASSDLERATTIARSMVTTHGMSNLGYINFLPYEEGGVLDTVSAETKHDIEKEVKRIIDEAYTRVKEMLTMHEGDLKKLSNMLVKEEEITGADIKKKLNWKTNYKSD